MSDLFLLPSSNESFGLAALEALALGVPVISSNAGGIPEVNKQGQTGYLCEVGDVDGMADCAIKLLSDDALLQKFSQQAYEHAKTFDVKGIVSQYEEMYERFLHVPV